MRQISLIVIMASSFVLFSCTANNIKIDNALGKFFTENNVKGCFALFDNGTGKITVYDRDRFFDSTYSPASTFKIVNSLIGLQEGKISSDTMTIPWDGIERSVPEWNKDLTMYEAFRVSSVPYYQEVARRIGRERMQFWLDSIGYAQKYGKQPLTGPIDSFWLNGTVKVTPDEQLGLVNLLYFDKLPFFRTYQEMVKRAMLFEDNSNYQLSYKTGWTGWNASTNRQVGWIIGWVVENKHPYFFVLNIESESRDFDMPVVRMKMLKDILKKLGFLEGKM
ncbi:MAG: class D beta-lactamase [Terrimonas sp.]|nr:class D beta-lactamase [Terrimonas sp.]